MPGQPIRGRGWRIAALTVCVLVLGVVLYLRWWDKDVGNGLGRWAVGEVSRRTGGTYRLVLAQLDFRPVTGSLSFDSAIVVTDSVANRARAAPLPQLAIRATGCRISGVHTLRLLLFKRFDADHMGCSSVSAAMQLLLVAADSAGPPDTADTRAPGERPAAPLGISHFRIAEVAFPTLVFSLRRPGPRGESTLSLERARLAADLLEYDPMAPLGHRAGSTKGLRLEASGFLLRPDTVSEFAIGRIDVGLSDSTVRLDSVIYRLRVPDSVWTRAQRTRRDRILFGFDSLVARGLAFRTFIRTGEFNIRALEMNGARLDVLSDKRRPSGPNSRHSIPQDAAQRSHPALRLDTLLIREGTIIYQEQKPKHDSPGRLTFGQVQGSITNIDVPSRGKPLEINVTARLMNAGLLSAHATVPLDAPDFRFQLAGRLGTMPAMVLNDFLQHTEPMQLKGGTIDSMTFFINTERGVSKTTLTPYFHDLAIDFMGGGVGGFIKAGIIEFAANKFKVRSTNPEEAGKPPRKATTSRTYDPMKTWIAHLWLCLRDPMMKTIMK